MHPLAAGLALAATLAAPAPSGRLSAPPPGLAAEVARATAALVERHGEPQRPRIERGLRQAAERWRASDGDARAFGAFAAAHFLSDPAALEGLLARCEENLEQLDGTLLEAGRAFRRRAELDLGPLTPVDGLFAAIDPGAHATDDLFAGKVAFAALLNFPVTTLAEKLARGPAWTRREWAAARLADRFALRIPAEVNQGIAGAQAAADAYVADYNLYLHHLVEGGPAAPVRPFPKGLRLLSHWNLRDQIKAEYAGGADGLRRQRLVARAMERIVDQTIPAAAVNSPLVDWNPFTNEVWPAPAATIEGGAPPPARADPAREPDRRYAAILADFRAVRRADPYAPTAPTFIARRFDLDRELPEARVVALLEEVLTSPLLPRVARQVEARLGRPLEPHDLWYDGFRPRAAHGEAELDARVRARYPDVAAFERDLPAILERLGFAPERARFLAERIAVDPARGSGHAQPAARRGDRPRLRTRVGPGGMDYKGYNIAIHELGHNVEQVLSLYAVDSTLLAGVPNNAFTEALAFVFQARDLELLGLGRPGPEARRLLALNDLWMTYEIAGVGLVDLRTWKWLYAHPDATPAQLRAATVRIAREVWNTWYAPIFGVRDVGLLGVYAHMVNSFFYLPDYALGHLIAAQVEERFAAAPALGPEFERMATFGRTTPDVWMQHAAGAPVSAGALLRAASAALSEESPR